MVWNASFVRWSSISRLVRNRSCLGRSVRSSSSSSQRCWLSHVDANSVYCISWPSLSSAYVFAPEMMIWGSVFSAAFMKAFLATCFPFVRGYSFQNMSNSKS